MEYKKVYNLPERKCKLCPFFGPKPVVDIHEKNVHIETRASTSKTAKTVLSSGKKLVKVMIQGQERIVLVNDSAQIGVPKEIAKTEEAKEDAKKVQFVWSKEALDILLSTVVDMKEKYKCNAKSVLEEAKVKMCAAGYDYSYDKIYHKFQKMKKNYIKLRNEKNQSGNGRVVCKPSDYYEELDEIFHNNPTIEPPAKIGSKRSEIELKVPDDDEEVEEDKKMITPPSAKKLKKGEEQKKRHEDRIRMHEEYLTSQREFLALEKEKREDDKERLAEKKKTNDLLARLIEKV